jgi:hypothetical protein
VWKDWPLLRKGYADFTIFYSAGTIVRSGDAARLYDEQAQYRAQKAVTDVNIRKAALPYNHPPFEALLFLPFTYLPYTAALAAWVLTSICLVMFSLWIMRRYCPGLRLPSVAFLFVCALAFFPLFMDIFQGQDEALLLAMTVLAFLSLKAGKPFWAGACIGLGAFRPQIVFPLALILVCARKARVFAGFSISSLILSSVSAAVIGWKAFLAYPRYVWDLEQHNGYGSIIPADMPNLRGFISGFFREGSNAGLAVTILGSILIMLWAAKIFRIAERSGNLEVGFSAALLASILVSYHALPYDLSILLVAVLLLYPDLTPPAFQQSRWQFWLPVACLFFAPLQMMLWLKLGKFNWIVAILLLWMWAMAQQLAPPYKLERATATVALARQP